METKYVRVPFEVDLAKRIQNKECEGRIYDVYYNCPVRIVDFNFQTIHGKLNIAVSEIGEGQEVYSVLNDEGVIFLDRECKFDDKHAFMLEIPEYMTFKDGDVIAYDNVKDVFFIIGSKCSMTDENPHYYVKYENGHIDFGTENSFCRLKGSRLATEEERQKIFESLIFSSDFRAKECLERFFPNHPKSSNTGKNCEFKPFDKVLVRDNGGIWICSLFSHISKKQDKYKYITVTGSFENCIPYNEQTAHLLGKTENYE